jgi:hypothetical protein
MTAKIFIMVVFSFVRGFPSVTQNGDGHCAPNICAKTIAAQWLPGAMISGVFTNLSACLRLALATALVLIVSVATPFGAARATPQIDEAAPPLVRTTLDGSTFDLANAIGKISKRFVYM